MNLAQKMLAKGFSVLSKSSGQSETVTLAGVDYAANVNRLGKSGSKLPPDTMFPTGAVIQFAYPNMLTQPTISDVITDSVGISHRIEHVVFLGHCWECTCATNAA